MSESKPIIVHSAANPRIRHLLRMRDNRARRKAGRVLVDGWRETAAAIEAGLRLCQLALAERMLPLRDLAPHPELPPEFDRVLAADPRQSQTLWLSDPLLRKVAYGNSQRGVVAEFERPERGLERLELPGNPLLLVLDRIEKPGNLGAIFRVADAAGVDAVLLCDSADVFNPNAIRSSLGGVFQVPSAEGSENELRQFLGVRGTRLVAARVESAQPLWSADLTGPVAIIVGSEADGLGCRWQPASAEAPAAGQVEGLRIPMQGRGDSLNVSAATAVICYEALRQRS